MEENKIPKIALEYEVKDRRKVGKYRLRWENCVRRNVQKLGVKNWGIMTRLGRWQRILKRMMMIKGEQKYIGKKQALFSPILHLTSTFINDLQTNVV